jgi:hypothetical protein
MKGNSISREEGSACSAFVQTEVKKKGRIIEA